jgi:hypothetical protein
LSFSAPSIGAALEIDHLLSNLKYPDSGTGLARPMTAGVTEN